jgi:hypothetical protein
MGGHKLILLLAVLLCGLGCGRRRAMRSSLPALPNLAIPLDCASEITLMHCDTRVDPPRCASARVKYRKGCERILVQAGEF